MWHLTRKTTKRDRQVTRVDNGNVHEYSGTSHIVTHAVTRTITGWGQQLAVGAGMMSEFDTDAYLERERREYSCGDD